MSFLNNLPAIDAMMPALDLTVIQEKLAARARSKIGYDGPKLVN